MRYALFLACLTAVLQAYSQPHCPRNSHLYQFDRNGHPRRFSERLGSHPQFPFLQEVNGVSTAEQFIRAIRDSSVQGKYKREFGAFDLLLKNSGFKNGYKDLNMASLKDVFIPMGTIGNLGFYDPQRDLISYNYVLLEPAGESPHGVAAWKLTNRKGCYLYILHTCGNAYYPNEGGSGRVAGDCCKTLDVQIGVDTVQWKEDPPGRNVHVQVNFYEAILVPADKRGKNRGNGKKASGDGGYDTVARLIRHVDTVAVFPYGLPRQWKVYGLELSDKLTICRDSSLKIFTRLRVDSNRSDHKPEDLYFVVNDTSYNRRYVAGPSAEPGCAKKWEISLDGGLSFNSVPRFTSATVHSQTSGSQLAAELAISRIVNSWLQVGVMASAITLSYEDDVAYPGSVAGTYNEIWLGKPIVPLQLFGKATIGGPLGWQSTVALSAGYSLPMKAHIDDNGNVLTTDPQVKGGMTAGVRLGLLYFFSCRFGMGVTAGGQYFSNKNALVNTSLWAMPVMAGIRYRF
ncbi:MAG: hypothetical protein Q8932_09255 [Bacteroidota bacterium]|nr:hypothetical protein [Bacteroidota bacterium]MDP4253309.1 hypothetical protein [Bacteroidota bacterium]